MKKSFMDRFRPLRTPGQEAAAGMDADKERKKRIASYIDRMTGVLGDTPEDKYGEVLEKFQLEYPQLTDEKQLDMRVALNNIAARWEAAYEKRDQSSPNQALLRMHGRVQELKRWLGTAQ